MKHWLVKQEPSAYSWQDFVRDGSTAWTGVRNFQARNNLSSMKTGDRVLFYHSVIGKEIVGEATVSKEAFPDPTAKEGSWVSVELKPLRPFLRPVALDQVKAEALLENIALLKQSRLSVMPLTPAEYRHLLKLGGVR